MSPILPRCSTPKSRSNVLMRPIAAPPLALLDLRGVPRSIGTRGLDFNRRISDLKITSSPKIGQVFSKRHWNKFFLSLMKVDPWTATADSEVVQSGRPIFDDFFQHLWPYIGNNTANVVLQMVKRLRLIRIDQ
ncbi:hypothetical protein TNCV_3411091 [Trichonephila clavipes]|nr:hypothetical protein TNCV_3411091 [Trichonephila clavipes]